MSCYPKLQAGSKLAVASSKINSRKLEAKQQQAAEARKQADEQAAITYVLERLDPGELKRLLKLAHLVCFPRRSSSATQHSQILSCESRSMSWPVASPESIDAKLS